MLESLETVRKEIGTQSENLRRIRVIDIPSKKYTTGHIITEMGHCIVQLALKIDDPIEHNQAYNEIVEYNSLVRQEIEEFTVRALENLQKGK